MATKKLSDKKKIALLKHCLARAQVERFHYPDSDAREYCAGCGRSSMERFRFGGEGAHAGGCLVVYIAEVLKMV